VGRWTAQREAGVVVPSSAYDGLMDLRWEERAVPVWAIENV
jgi:hypothetical protein